MRWCGGTDQPEHDQPDESDIGTEAVVHVSGDGHYGPVDAGGNNNQSGHGKFELKLEVASHGVRYADGVAAEPAAGNDEFQSGEYIGGRDEHAAFQRVESQVRDRDADGFGIHGCVAGGVGDGDAIE